MFFNQTFPQAVAGTFDLLASDVRGGLFSAAGRFPRQADGFHSQLDPCESLYHEQDIWLPHLLDRRGVLVAFHRSEFLRLGCRSVLRVPGTPAHSVLRSAEHFHTGSGPDTPQVPWTV